MRVAFTATVIFLASTTSLGGPTSGSRCRCVYGESCWPSEADFTSLASMVSQPLIHPVPPESACYPASSPSGNCTAVLEGSFDGNWRANQSGSMQSPNFESYYFPNGTISACYLNASLGFPCEQGSVPVVGVDAQSVSDIQAAVKFVTNHRLRLAVKNTGHDYLGRSTARGSFLIWTHHLKNITYDNSFVPDGAPSSETYDAITLGAGVQWHEAYDTLRTKARIMVGGISINGSVGAAGGWVQGGGHSVLSPQYGLGVDNVVQFNIVTSSGDYLTVNSHQHPDLFWALRGGGGGTYGIVTSVTYRTFPSNPVTAVFFQANSTNATTMSILVEEFIRIQPALSDAGWGGYSAFNASGFGFLYLAPNTSSTALIESFYAFAGNLSSEGLGIVVSLITPLPSFYTWYDSIFSTGLQVGFPTEVASRLLPRDLVENDYAKVTQTLLGLQSGGVSFYLIAGGAVSKVDPDSTGLNPAWRSALVHVIWGAGWTEGTPGSAINQLRDKIKADTQTVETLAPGSGSYFNEASLYEKNPQHTFFGSHYGRLKAIKAIYDPTSMFVVAEGVGSDKWDSSLNCRLSS